MKNYFFMLKIGVLGVGHLGEIHVKLITQLTQYYKLIGFYDPNDYNAKNIIQKYHIKRFFSLEELIKEVDCLDIVTPTITHFDCASKALKMSKHLFIEKPGAVHSVIMSKQRSWTAAHLFCASNPKMSLHHR